MGRFSKRFARRLVATAVPAAMTAGLVLVGAPASVAVGELGGKQTVCVSGTQGKYARLAVIDDERRLVRIVYLSGGCVTFRIGKDLPAGEYRIKHRAPKGRLTGIVEQSAGKQFADGSAISGTSRERRPPPLKKVKARAFEMHPDGFGTIDFHSVKNRHR